MKQYQVDGQVYEVPDDVTHEEVAQYVMDERDPLSVSTEGVEIKGKSAQEFATDPENLAADFTPVLGSIRSANDLKDAIERGDVTDSILAGIGLIPFAGGVVKGGRTLSHIFHGGTRLDNVELDFNKLGTGEPGNIRPLGLAFYGTDSEKLAERYVKYGEDGNAGITRFDLAEDTTLYPKGSAWHDFDAEYLDKLRPKIARAEKALQSEGFRYKYLTDALAFETNRTKQERIREILVESGIDGVIENLPVGAAEIGILNPKVLSNPKLKEQ